MPANKLTLRPDRWYGWQMLPGYSEGFDPYVSPIFMEKVTPLGDSKLELHFINAFYAEGVQDFTQQLTVLARHPTYLVGHIKSSSDRTAVVSEISFNWLRDFTCLLEDRPNDQDLDVQSYLTANLLRS